MPWNRIRSGSAIRLVSGGIPNLLRRGCSCRRDLNQDLPLLWLGTGRRASHRVIPAVNSITFISAIASLREIRFTCYSESGKGEAAIRSQAFGPL